MDTELVLQFTVGETHHNLMKKKQSPIINSVQYTHTDIFAFIILIDVGIKECL